MSYLDIDYKFSDSFLAPLVMIEEVPESEGATNSYIMSRLAAVADIPLNFAAAGTHNLFDPLDSLEDYDDIFQILPAPDCTKFWQKDRIFAEQRLSGVHPNWIRRATGKILHESVLDDVLKTLVGADSDKVKSDGLYVCDYREITKDIPVGIWEGRRKYLSSVCGYFVWRDVQNNDRGELIPVMIEIDQTEVATPLSDFKLWQSAKLHLQIADAVVHETCSHLYDAHFAMEPIAVATGRYLPSTHPVRRLLTPHFRFLLFNNDLGKNRLVNPGGFVDQLLAPSLAGSMELVKRAAQSFNFSQKILPNDIKARGMDKIPHYPYRDDGLLIWDAIGQHVENCLTKSYAGKQVTDDQELMNWWKSLSAYNGARLQGIPSSFDLTTLSRMLQHIIFVSGPYHAAVNFPQYEYMAFTPNMPLAAYAPYPAPLLDTLPPYKQISNQLEIMEILTSYRHDQLGCYDQKDMARLTKQEQRSLSEFQDTLAAIERKIIQRNKLRKLPYKYLLPSLIPNSTSV